MEQEVRYSGFLKLLHWLVAILVIMMLSFSFFLEGLPEPYIPQAFVIHKSIGLTILFLMLIRALWILIKGRPAFPPTMQRWQQVAARMVHHGFYVFLILMPLSGWIMSVAAGKVPVWFNLFQVPFPGVTSDKALAGVMNQSHKIIAWIIIVLVILHIAAALKHYFIDKDGVMERMLPDERPHQK